MSSDTSSEAFFEAKYQCEPDPWNFTSSGYEQERYSAIVGQLHGRKYRRAFEPGCSIGVLTEQLAQLCGHVEAIDISATAAAQARKRCQPFPNVRISQGAFPEAIPGGMFDLVVLSEIGYYFSQSQLQFIASELVSRMPPEGVFLIAHWLGHSTDHKLSGDQVHAIIAATPKITLQAERRFSGFRIDKWIKQ